MATHETLLINESKNHFICITGAIKTNSSYIAFCATHVVTRDGFLEHAPQGRACRAFYFMNKGV